MSATKTNPRRSKKKSRPDKPKAGLGVIEPNVVYPRWEFIKRVGTTPDGFRSMRERGLKTIEDGKRTMIIGRNYLEYLESLPAKPEKNSHSGTSSVAEPQAEPT